MAASGTVAAAAPGKRKGMGASPALCYVALLAMAVAGMATPTAAAVYKVGESAGWTIIGNVNYTTWAASKAFHVGDTIVFKYNKQFHNVLEVSKPDYRGCNPQSPLSTHATGNDSFTLTRAGHRFFLCGVPGHCTLGQKVDIRVPKHARAAPAPATATANASSSPGTVALAPAPPKNGAAPRTVGWAAVALVLAAAIAAASVGLH